MELEWKTAEGDGWSKKPYEIARHGKLTFRLTARTRTNRRANIAIWHDDVQHRRDGHELTAPIVYKTHDSTQTARGYAENFDYDAWRSREIKNANEAITGAARVLERCREQLKETESLPANA